MAGKSFFMSFSCSSRKRKTSAPHPPPKKAVSSGTRSRKLGTKEEEEEEKKTNLELWNMAAGLVSERARTHKRRQLCLGLIEIREEPNRRTSLCPPMPTRVTRSRSGPICMQAGDIWRNIKF